MCNVTETLSRYHVCVFVVLAPPSVLGAWSMALVLWLPFECYWSYQNFTMQSHCKKLLSQRRRFFMIMMMVAIHIYNIFVTVSQLGSL